MAEQPQPPLLDPYSYGSFLVSSLLMPLFFFVTKRVFARHIKAPGQLAWLLTLFSSTVMTASSLPVVFSGMVYQDDLLENPFFNPPFGVCSTAFFAAYLLLDIAIGWFYYREKLDPITGWLHHALYLSICITAIQLGATGLFMLACFMELPTIFLSLGHIHAPWRNDLIFGSVFFLTRIVYHGYLIWHVKVHMPSNYYFYVLAILVLPMHLYWFYRFAMQQIRNWRRSRSLALEQSSGV